MLYLYKISMYLGLALVLGGYGWMRASRTPDSMMLPLLTMGAGVLLMLFPSFKLSFSLSKIEEFRKDKKLARMISRDKLNFFFWTALMAAVTGLYLSPGGVNKWTVGFTSLALGAGLIYAVGYSISGGKAGASNTVRLAFSAGGFMGLIVCAVTLISQLSGASDMPTRWNIYTLEGVVGLAASGFAIYYGMAYQTNLDLLDMLEPLGFAPAESGPLGRDGVYDARGTWKGVDTLVNVDQSSGHKNSGPSFSLLLRCEVPGRRERLLAHPGGVLQRPIGAPFTLPKAAGPGDWADLSVGCEPPEAAAGLLAALGSPASNGFTERAGFTHLLLEEGRLTVGFSREGYPSLDYLKGKLNAAAAAAAALRGAPGAGRQY
jgi:hypothetical protein